MRLTVLGGSAAGPNPGQGCSGYLVGSGATRVVLDLGPGTLPELRRHANFREIDAVVLSHLHLDHMLDILALRFALAYNPISPSGPVALWVPPGGVEFFASIANVLATEQAEDYFSEFALHEYDPAAELAIGSLQIRFSPTVHYVPCWAMRVSNGVDGDLFYTADSGPAARLETAAAGSEILVAEGTERVAPPGPEGDRGHMTPSEAGVLASRAGVRTLLLTHLWAEHNPCNALEEAALAFGGQVMIAVPGLVVSWRADAIEAR